jgi:hypothetical protein
LGADGGGEDGGCDEAGPVRCSARFLRTSAGTMLPNPTPIDRMRFFAVKSSCGSSV